MANKVRPLNQEDWKRSQIRIPPELRARLVEEAHKNESSLNDAMIFYIEQGFKYQAENPPQTQEPQRTPQRYSDFIHDVIGVNEKMIEQIADKVAERLKEK